MGTPRTTRSPSGQKICSSSSFSSSNSWKHCWSCSWIPSSCSVVGCSTYTPRTTCSPSGQKICSSSSFSCSNSWKHCWSCSWIPSCCSVGAAQLIHQGQLAHHQGKRSAQAPASVPVTPGNIAGLVPGSKQLLSGGLLNLYTKDNLLTIRAKDLLKLQLQFQ